MIITIPWLKEHLKTNAKEIEIISQLTNIGLEVESVKENSGEMGKFKIELISSVSGKIFDEKLKLQALNSMCSILEKVLPERQSYTEIFNASNAFINLLTLQDQRKNDHWIEGYVKWEIGVLSSIALNAPSPPWPAKVIDPIASEDNVTDWSSKVLSVPSASPSYS